MTIRDEVMPEGSWKFDEEVTDAFDDMLERSIPQYDVMRETVGDVGAQMIRNQGAARQQAGGYVNARILDLGTSRGGALAGLVRRFGARGKFLGVEVSEPMVTAAKERFSGYDEWVEIRQGDLRVDPFPEGPWHLIQAVLTLQFIPIEHRERIVADAYDELAPGGAFILVEKVLGENRLDEDFVRLYHERKRSAGYTAEQVERKRLALEGVLVPITASWNVDLLRNAGFWPIDCFWRWLNFAGWVAVKR